GPHRGAQQVVDGEGEVQRRDDRPDGQPQQTGQPGEQEDQCGRVVRILLLDARTDPASGTRDGAQFAETAHVTSLSSPSFAEKAVSRILRLLTPRWSPVKPRPSVIFRVAHACGLRLREIR